MNSFNFFWFDKLKSWCVEFAFYIITISIYYCRENFYRKRKAKIIFCYNYGVCFCV